MSRTAIKNVYECSWRARGLLDKNKCFIYADSQEIAKLKCAKIRHLSKGISVSASRVVPKGSGIPYSIKRIYR